MYCTFPTFKKRKAGYLDRHTTTDTYTYLDRHTTIDAYTYLDRHTTIDTYTYLDRYTIPIEIPR